MSSHCGNRSVKLRDDAVLASGAVSSGRTMARASRRKRPSCLWAFLVLAGATGAWGAADEPARIIERMQSSYARLSDYQMRVDSTASRGESAPEETRLLYRYKKPGKIRIDFIRPRKGWTLVYPSDRGKVVLRPSGFLSFLKFSLDPDNSLLTVWPGQQVTQTDLGLLIEHIARSLTDQRLGPVEISRVEGDLVIRVEAENHFLDGVPTKYEFFVDANRWLPTGVSEDIPELRRKRRIRFQEIQVDPGLPGSLFELR